LGAQDIAINQLRIKGLSIKGLPIKGLPIKGSLKGADHSAAQAFARELETSSWPLQLPANLQHAWVFVRELHVNGKPQELRHQTAQQLQQLLSQVVDGRRASANSTAVRFESLPQLLAFLVRDLALGQASGKWYWQRWNYLLRSNREQAVAQLLVENIPELAAVITQLSSLGQLPLLWQSLSSNTALTLVEQVARHYGFSVTVSALEPLTASSIESAAAHIFQQKSASLRAWRPLLATTPASDHRWLLAALVTGISACPLLVMRNPHAVVRAFKWQLSDGDSAWLDAENITAIANEKPLRSNAVAADEHKIPAGDVTDNSAKVESPKRLDDGEQHSSSASVTATQKPLKIASRVDFSSSVVPLNLPEQNAVENPLEQHASVLTVADQSHAISLPEDDASLLEPESDASQFVTQLGGLFYLINALRMVITAELLNGQLQANAWLWWFDIARLLAQRFDFTLDEFLTRFSAATLGVENSQALLSSPISAEAHSLLIQLDEVFAKQTFWGAGEFIKVPAQVVADASHIDIYFPLSAVRLDIRLAGLDVNPGWIPWLGRVVRFHYIDSPQLDSYTRVTTDGN